MNTCSNGGSNELFQVYNVIVNNNTIILPCSSVQLPCSLSTTLGNYVVEPLDSDMEFISPRSLHSKESKPIICIVNVSVKYLKLKQGHIIGIAIEIQEIIEKLHCKNVRVQKITPSKEVHEIPEHLQELPTKSVEHLSPQEKVLLQDVLLSYSDVFAKNEFDLGNFTAIEHNIYTGDAAPIKQRLRRTPACNVGEEEKHLNKLLDPGVIEHSISEWASAHV